ncbi:MAG: hypothetical protein HYS07_05750 [Chlamydiae bacterium]|nr:hypothetical protein [Chlamydiota bacterium]MBI3277936.1 hypothetical protein [Chlamydiota bacterium]
MNIESWPISKLSNLSTPFNSTFGDPPKLLEDSIQKIGVIHPPLLLTEKTGQPILISGKRRIEIAKKINPHQTLWVKSYTREELTNLQAFHLNLYENLSIRKFNAIEKSNVLALLTNLGISQESLQKEYLSLLELPLKEETPQQYFYLQKLDEETKQLVSLGILQVDSALILLKLDFKDRSCLTSLIQNLRLGVNPQKILIRLAWDIFKKGNIPPHELFESQTMKNILEEESWSTGQKWASIEYELRKLRYPRLSQMEEEFKNIKKEMKLPPTITLQSPPYFESPDYALQLRFRNLEDYQEKLAILQQMGNNKNMEKLFKLTTEYE